MSGFFQNLGPTELIIIGLILIIFFGSKRIASLGKTAGEATREFKKVKKEIISATEEAKSDVEETLETDGQKED